MIWNHFRFSIFTGAATSLLFLIFFLIGVAGKVSAEPQQLAKWTVMVYMAGDNDLEEYIVDDLETELGAIGSSERVQVVALADRGPGFDQRNGDWQTTKLFHLTRGMKATAAGAVADWGERNMGDGRTLIDFVEWTKAHYPAEHYALYFWGHGWNWHPNSVMWDATSADALEMGELRAALPALGFIDMVAYDGCDMASIEVDWLWHGHATAVSHSQEFVGGEGVQYDQVLSQLTRRPQMTADELAIATSQSASADETWSAVAVDDRLDKLAAAITDWSIQLTQGRTTHRRSVDRAFRAARSFWRAPMDKDLYDLALEIDRHVSDPEIKFRSRAVMNAVKNVVLHERHSRRYSDAHGLSIYLPAAAGQRDRDFPYYQTLDFARDTGWGNFLKGL